jgi:hypothetical protein
MLNKVLLNIHNLKFAKFHGAFWMGVFGYFAGRVGGIDTRFFYFENNRVEL